jgi:hypothetical protein
VQAQKVKLPHIHSFRDRFGKQRHYFRRPGQKAIPLPGDPGSPQFTTAYCQAASDYETRQQPLLNQQPLLKLYVIRADKSTLFKVGISEDPKERLRTLQTGSPFRLKIIHAVFVSSFNQEREAHRLLAPWRIHGEWFDLKESADFFSRKVRRSADEGALFNALCGIFNGAISAPVKHATYLLKREQEAQFKCAREAELKHKEEQRLRRERDAALMRLWRQRNRELQTFEARR